MSDHLVHDAKAAETLPIGQWAVAADKEVICLFETHMGFPQRMWGIKKDGGTKGYVTNYTALKNVAYPIHLADANPKTPCPHKRTNECGQCTVCGLPDMGDRREVYFDGIDATVFKFVAENNARIKGSE